MRPVAAVRARLALPRAWGARNARVFATVSVGERVVFLEGAAAEES
jgi:hypothetical protein